MLLIFPEMLSASFKFEIVFDNDVKKMKKLRYRKSIDKRFRSRKFLETICECLIHLLNFINYSFQHSAFPEEVKLSKMTPLYKKLDLFQKENYKTLVLLPHI